MTPQDQYVSAGGLKLRYLEAGAGPPVILLHGASLGSSADVFIRNLGPLADAGFRAIAFDSPGFGLSDTPANLSNGFRSGMILKFMDALGLQRAALAGHSQSGGPAVQIALQNPDRVSHVIVLGTGSLLPPADDGKGKAESAVQQRLERRMAAQEPTLEDTRKLLEATLFHTALITPEELALRHSRSIGPAFAAFCARNDLADAEPAKAPAAPLWKRLPEVSQPMLMLFGREDRAKAFERATALKAQMPQLDLQIIEGCKHLVPWDAADLWVRLAAAKMRQTAGAGA